MQTVPDHLNIDLMLKRAFGDADGTFPSVPVLRPEDDDKIIWNPPDLAETTSKLQQKEIRGIIIGADVPYQEPQLITPSEIDVIKTTLSEAAIKKGGEITYTPKNCNLAVLPFNLSAAFEKIAFLRSSMPLLSEDYVCISLLADTPGLEAIPPTPFFHQDGIGTIHMTLAGAALQILVGDLTKQERGFLKALEEEISEIHLEEGDSNLHKCVLNNIPQWQSRIRSVPVGHAIIMGDMYHQTSSVLQDEGRVALLCFA